MKTDHLTTEQKCVIIVAVLVNFVAPFMTSALNLSIKTMSTDFQCDMGATTWIVNAYTLATAMFSIPLGHLADIKGRRRMIISGCAAYIAFAAFCVCSNVVWMVMAGRFLMGVTAAMFLGAALPLMLSYFPPQQQGRYIGISVAAVSVGVAVGPAVGGIMNDLWGWRSIFILTIAICFVALVICAKFVSADKVEQSGKIDDMLGNVLFIASTGVTMYGLGQLGALWFAPVLLVVGIIAFVVFCVLEYRINRPAIQVRLFTDSAPYTLANLSNLVNFIAIYSVTYVMATHLQTVYGLSSSIAGLVMMSTPVIQAICSPFAGRLSERIEPNRIATAGMVAVSLGLVFLVQVGAIIPLPLIIVGLLFIGFGSAIFASSNTAAVLVCVDNEHKSEANATISGMRGIGQCCALAMAGAVYQFTIPNATVSSVDAATLASSNAVIMAASLIFAVITVVLCIAAAWTTSKGNKKSA